MSKEKVDPVNPKQRGRGRGNNGGNPNRGMHPHNGGGGQRHINVRTQVFDSNGPEGRIRGTAYQVMEKYLALGRDASSQGDRVAAENFFQHAEHYFRLINAYNQNNAQRRPPQQMNPYGEGQDQGDGQEEGGSDFGSDSMNTPAGADQGVPVVDMEAEPMVMAAPMPMPMPVPAPMPVQAPVVAAPVAEPQPDYSQMEQPDVVMPMPPMEHPVEASAGGEETTRRAPRRQPVRRRAPRQSSAEGEEQKPQSDNEPVLL